MVNRDKIMENTVYNLIKKLTKYPPDMPVTLLDLRKNAHFADDEGSSEGIYSKYEVSIIEADLIEDTKPFVVISFNNDDYNEDGSKAD